jgi:hypothetical protein
MNRAQHVSLAAGNVVAVLLADGWHKVTSGSFTVGRLGFGDGDGRDVLGYRFEELDDASPYGPATLAGPLEALLAIRQVTPRATRCPDRYQDRPHAIAGHTALASR